MTARKFDENVRFLEIWRRKGPVGMLGTGGREVLRLAAVLGEAGAAPRVEDWALLAACPCLAEVPHPEALEGQEEEIGKRVKGRARGAAEDLAQLLS